MAEIPWVELVTILVATGAIYLGSDWLEEASAKLAIHYELPPVVQGGIIAAAGSSFPELASVIFAALAGSFGLGVGAIVGSAIFNVLVIPALAVLLSPGNVNSTRTLVHKENLFYMLAVVVLFLIFAMAVIYNPTAPQVGRLSRELAVVPLVVYGLYLFLQWQDTADYVATAETVKTSPLRQWAALAGGLLVILVAVERLVHSVIIVGDTVGTPDFLWGVTIVAAATSLPDAIVSIQAAGKERDVASISNVLGSNTFDLLVVIPIGVLLTGSALIDFSIAAPMMGCLVGATVLLFMALRTQLELSTREAYVLLAAYVLFVAWVASEALHVTTFLL
jgi:cation:H+ antiporter